MTGIMANRKYSTYPPTEYMTLFILNGDRTRFKNTKLGYDWTHIPTDLGAPLVQNAQMITSKVEQKPVICDVDGDGKVTIRDTTAIQFYLAGLRTPYNLDAADANGDGIIGVDDVTYIQKLLAGIC